MYLVNVYFSRNMNLCFEMSSLQVMILIGVTVYIFTGSTDFVCTRSATEPASRQHGPDQERTGSDGALAEPGSAPAAICLQQSSHSIGSAISGQGLSCCHEVG